VGGAPEAHEALLDEHHEPLKETVTSREAGRTRATAYVQRACAQPLEGQRSRATPVVETAQERCGRFVRIREQHPAMTYRATPRCLPRQSQARGVEPKALAPPIAMLAPRKWSDGVMDGDRSCGVRSNLHLARFQAVEGTPAFGKALPFAGKRRNAGLGRFMRAVGASSPPIKESMT